MGKAYVKVTGKGKYAGSKLAEFNITLPENRLTIDYVAVTDTGYTYTGEEIMPKYSAWYIPYYGAKRTEWVELLEDKDFTVDISDNILAGKGKIKVTGIGIYTGESNYTFTIDKAKPLTTPQNKTIAYDQTINSIHWESGWSINGTTPIIQTGETANVELIYFDTENYTPSTTTIQVTREAAPTDAINLNNATITLTTSNFTYTGNAIKPDITVNYNGTILNKGTNYSVDYSNNKNVGTATIIVTGTGDYCGSRQITFKINESDLSTSTITFSDSVVVYNGSEQKPSVIVKLGDKTLVKDTDYAVSYKDNIVAGEAVVTITGIGNYSGGTSEKFTIKKAEKPENTPAQTMTVESGVNITSIDWGDGWTMFLQILCLTVQQLFCCNIKTR
jgi:hypothetical protein